jgi:electron transfer flavoprotein alpha subunit
MAALVIAEHDNLSLKAATLNAVAAALQCSPDVDILVAGSGADPAAAAAAQVAGVRKVIQVDAPGLADQLAESLAAQILSIASNYSHLLAPATANGKNVMPRVAAKLDVAQLSDITKVVSADTFERPIYAGNAIATVQSGDPVKVITVRTTGFDPVEVVAAQLVLRSRQLLTAQANLLLSVVS